MQDKTVIPDQKQAQESVPSARDTIVAAFDEHKEKLAQIDDGKSGQKPPIATQEEKKEEATKAESKKEEVKETSAEKKEEVSELKEVKETKEEKKEEKTSKVEPDKKSKVPFGIPKEIRAEWDNLSPNAQGFLSKVVKENLDHKAAEGRRGHMRDVEQVLTPYYPEIQKLGVSPAQVVKRLLDYSDALAHPQYKYAAIESLAANYGIDLSLFGVDPQQQTQQNQDQNQQNQPQNQTNVNYTLDPRLDTIVDRFNKLENAQVEAQRSANDKVALEYVNTWAGFNPTTNEYTSKPYFPYVRQQMVQLITSGVIPIENGKVDLDGAYEAACHANPQIRELIEEDRNKTIRVDVQNRNQQAVHKARIAGSSIRSGAPIPNNTAINNSKTPSGKPLSVRDSIRQALSDMRS